MSSIYKPAIFLPYTNLVAAESRRNGGFSSFPYQSLNLGLNTMDQPDIVQENRQLFFKNLGFTSEQTATSYQCHSDQIALVTAPCSLNGFDALITQTSHILLGVTIADCTPILIFHPNTNTIAAIHAGWRGTVAKIAEKTVSKMDQQFGVNPQECLAYIGTCIDVDNYEVGEEVASNFETSHKRWNPAKQKFHVNLKKANLDQLLRKGIPLNQIEISPYSTFSDNHLYFSHRKENGVTGRMMAVIGLID